jgi:ParB-like chromosome segregation protein Spo0J
MNIETIPMTHLHAHPQNANVMQDTLLKKLKIHIQRHGQYEPLVVRPHPQQTGHYQLLNGHHRKQILEELGHQNAHCVVWNVDDNEALILLATLNRLNGQDNPVKRSALLDELTRRYERRDIAAQLPETAAQLQKLLAIAAPPHSVQPEPFNSAPQAMTFFVTAPQKKQIDLALRQMRQCVEPQDHAATRGDILTKIASFYLFHNAENKGGFDESD